MEVYLGPSHHPTAPDTEEADAEAEVTATVSDSATLAETLVAVLLHVQSNFGGPNTFHPDQSKHRLHGINTG